ncbi:MAG: hypothetical protein PHF60_00650 [Candidatus ainarchaeum sp.]|nr:hypothetical protein [Candidatus ainarchaeum sp.]
MYKDSGSPGPCKSDPALMRLSDPATRRSDPNIARRTSTWHPALDGLTAGMDDIKSNLISSNPPDRATAAWDARIVAERGEDISSILSHLSLAFRKDNGSSTRQHVIDAVMFHTRAGRDPSSAMSVVSSCLQSENLQLRHSAIMALAYYADHDGDIALYVKLLVSRLSDMAQINRDAAVHALSSYAAQGKPQAHEVFKQVDNLAAEGAQELRQTCLESLRS